MVGSQVSVLVVVQVSHLSVDVAGSVARDVGDVETDQAGWQTVVQGVDTPHIDLGFTLENLGGRDQDVGHETVSLGEVEGGQFV